MVNKLTVLTGLSVLLAGIQPSIAQERIENIFDKEREDYKADGVRLGAFELKPSINISETYNDNIFAVETGQTSDMITNIRPGFELSSDWSNHELVFAASGDFGLYADNDDEDYQDYSVSTDLRLDVLNETHVTAGASYDHLHEDRGSADDVNGKDPTEYDVTTGRVGLYRGLRKFSFSLDGVVSQYDYDDVSTSTGTIIDNDDRDRDEYGFTAQVGYEIVPEYQAFIRYSANKREYDQNAGTNRDSDGYEVVAGTAINLSGKARGEIYAGYIEQNYDNAAFRDIDGLSFGGNLLWNPTSLTSVNLNANRSIEETTTAGASGYVATSYIATVEHELRRNILLGLDVSTTNNDYEGGSPSREDDVSSVGLRGKYLFSRRIDVGVQYNYDERDSNIVGQDYHANKLYLDFSFKL
ncbi:outer membrane beta-barrel protein [Rickettsiales bacterium]|nr:outer membrane beta-barrel protein [Rickettsiales bacterium]